MVSITIAIKELVNYFKSLLAYFCKHWEITKIILSNISNNKIIPDEIILDENFPDYGSSI